MLFNPFAKRIGKFDEIGSEESGDHRHGNDDWIEFGIEHAKRSAERCNDE